MKRKMRKVMAMVLALSICFNTASMNVFAQEQTTEMSTEVSTELQTEMQNEIQTETQTEAQTETQVEKTTEASTETNTTVSGNEVVEEIPEENWDGVTTESVYEGDNFKVTFLLTGHWEGGYSAKVKIENTGDSVIENWGLGFEYPDKISELSNAVIDSQKDGKYVIKNAGWNQNIAIGACAEFSFSGKQNFSGFPKEYKLLGSAVSVDEEDYTIEYHLEDNWGNGFTASISITNNTDSVLENWVLEFDYDREITKVWDAVIDTQDGNHYIIKNDGHNSNIAPGNTVSFGFNGISENTNIIPKNYEIFQHAILDIDFELDVSNMDFKESDTGNFYLLFSDKSSISGWARNMSSVKDFTYTIEDEYDVLSSGTIEKNEQWRVDNVGFASGYNLLTVTADIGEQKIEKKYIIINMNLNNMKNLNIDIYADSDGDGISDYFEKQLGLNSSSEDTDGDGLNDYLEVFIPNLSPTNEDGDQDGILDINEDYDQDGLNNYEEENIYHTDLSLIDTDNDGLIDKEEVLDYYTDPNEKDTDGDGLDDYWELKIKSNPLEKESSFSYTQKLDDADTHLTVPMVTVENISAQQVESFSINRITENDLLNEEIPGYIDNGYEFHIDGEFQNAIVEIAYDESLVDDNFYPALYYYNEETQLLEYVENQRMENGKVIASLEHFSKYILLNKTLFDKVWSYSFLYDENAESYEGLDVVFVIDSSGSMSWNDPNNIRKSVTKKFIEKLTDKDTAALVSFDSTALTLSGFTNDKNILYSATNRLDSSGGTSLSAGISRAISLFKSKEETDNKLKYIIMLTDGDGSYSTTYTTQAVNEKIIIYTIGLGSSVSKSVLTNMAESTGGSYYHVNDADQLYCIFDAIAEKADYYKDTDNDGLNDYFEKEMSARRLVLGTGIPLSVNYLNADSDGDGLLDGEEIKVNKINNHVYVSMYSNPTKKDSDADGMNDKEDSLPLVPNSINEMLIHQTQHGEGLKKYSDFNKNIVADDLTFNDYSYTEIVNEVGLVGTVAGITPEYMMWAELTDLFLIGCVTSDMDMSITLIDMLDEFRYGNKNDIGKVVNIDDEFDTTNYNRYSDYTLTERAKNYEEFNGYLNDIKNIVINELSKNEGNLSVLKCSGPQTGIIYDKAYDKEVNYPVFSLKKDISLVLAIHDFQGHNITITNYKCDGKNFSGTIEFHFYDHFGLDYDDYEWAPGFCDWFTLQHYDRFNGEHPPFITVIDTSIQFSGEIK